MCEYGPWSVSVDEKRVIILILGVLGMPANLQAGDKVNVICKDSKYAIL